MKNPASNNYEAGFFSLIFHIFDKKNLIEGT